MQAIFVIEDEAKHRVFCSAMVYLSVTVCVQKAAMADTQYVQQEAQVRIVVL
jgi:hypothetical protein